jgi:hypothetical protein
MPQFVFNEIYKWTKIPYEFHVMTIILVNKHLFLTLRFVLLSHWSCSRAREIQVEVRFSWYIRTHYFLTLFLASGNKNYENEWIEGILIIIINKTL